jgi:thiamine kinase-like enzyme
MDNIQTTGGLLTNDIYLEIINNICDVFDCNESQLKDIEPLQKGLSNIVLSFRYNGGKYVYRHPGLGSDELIDRGREAIIQKNVEDAGVDTTLIAMSVKQGWRVSRYIDARPFNYRSTNDMARGIRLLRQLHNSEAKVRWEFDVLEKMREIKSKTPSEFESIFDGYQELKVKIEKLYEYASKDGIKKCLSHGDSRDENFLINDKEIYLIDWEYAGFGDPGFDLGTYICGGEHSTEDVEAILRCYFGRTPNKVERRHFLAYIAIAGFFYMHWTMYKEFKGQEIGELKRLWYHYALKYSDRALRLYEKEVRSCASLSESKG